MFTSRFLRIFGTLRNNDLQLLKISNSIATSVCQQYSKFDDKVVDADAQPVYQFVGENYERATSVYVWGYTEVGALGMSRFVKPRNKKLTPKKSVNKPRRLPFSHKVKIKDLACGYGFTVLTDGKYIYGTGLNNNSQIGHHEARKLSGVGLERILEPVMIKLPVDAPDKCRVLDVGCGRAHTIILTDQGAFSLGNNAYGQCGRPVVKGEIYKNNPRIHAVHGLPDDVKQVCCGLDHTLFLTATGQVWSCGWSADGQTGVGSYDSIGDVERVRGDIDGETIVHLASAADCVLACNDAGELFGWGSTEYGQLAAAAGPDEPQVNVPRHLPLPVEVGRVKQVAVGASICYVLNESGEVYTWGCGVLGLGPTVSHVSQPRLLPPPLFGRNMYSPHIAVSHVYAGVHMSAAINTDGHLFTWGQPIHGNLGLAHNTRTQFFPLKVSLPAEAQHLSVGIDHVAVICRSFA